MNISFECVQCEADFELEHSDLLKDPTLVVCPNCGSKADTRVVESAVGSLDEFLSQLSRMRRKFRVLFSLESDEFSDNSEEFVDEESDEEALWSNAPDEDEEEED